MVSNVNFGQSRHTEVYLYNLYRLGNVNVSKSRLTEVHLYLGNVKFGQSRCTL